MRLLLVLSLALLASCSKRRAVPEQTGTPVYIIIERFETPDGQEVRLVPVDARIPGSVEPIVLTIQGQHFTPDAQVELADPDDTTNQVIVLLTEFLSSTAVTFELPPSFLTTSASGPIVVHVTAPGREPSGALTLTYVATGAVGAELFAGRAYDDLFRGQSGVDVKLIVFNNTTEEFLLTDLSIHFTDGAGASLDHAILLHHIGLDNILTGDPDTRGTLLPGTSATLPLHVAATNDLPFDTPVDATIALGADVASGGIGLTQAVASIKSDLFRTGSRPALLAQGGAASHPAAGVTAGAGGDVTVDATGLLEFNSAFALGTPVIPAPAAGFTTVSGTHSTAADLTLGSAATDLVIDAPLILENTGGGPVTVRLVGVNVFVASAGSIDAAGQEIDVVIDASGAIYIEGDVDLSGGTVGGAAPSEDGGSFTCNAVEGAIVVADATIDTSGGIGTVGPPGAAGYQTYDCFAGVTIHESVDGQTGLLLEGGSGRLDEESEGGDLTIRVRGGPVRIAAGVTIETRGGRQAGVPIGDAGDSGSIVIDTTVGFGEFELPIRGDVFLGIDLDTSGRDATGVAQGAAAGPIHIIGGAVRIAGNPAALTNGGAASVSGGFGGRGGDAGNAILRAGASFTLPDGGGLVAIGGAGRSETGAHGGFVSITCGFAILQDELDLTVEGNVDASGGFAFADEALLTRGGDSDGVSLWCTGSVRVGSDGLVAARGGFPTLPDRAAPGARVSGGSATGTVLLRGNGNDFVSSAGGVTVDGCIDHSGADAADAGGFGDTVYGGAGGTILIQAPADGADFSITGEVKALGGGLFGDPDDAIAFAYGAAGAIDVDAGGSATVHVGARLIANGGTDILGYGRLKDDDGVWDMRGVDAQGRAFGEIAIGVDIEAVADDLVVDGLIETLGTKSAGTPGIRLRALAEDSNVELGATGSLWTSALCEIFNASEGRDGEINVIGAIRSIRTADDDRTHLSHAGSGDVVVSGDIEHRALLIEVEGERFFGDIVITGTILLTGGFAGDGFVATGGDELFVAGDVTVQDTNVRLDAGRLVNVSGTVRVSGGSVVVFCDESVTVNGLLETDGRPRENAGDIVITAVEGDLFIGGTMSAAGGEFTGFDATGVPLDGGNGGTIHVEGPDVRVSGALLSVAGGSNTAGDGGFGGVIRVVSSGDVTLLNSLDLQGGEAQGPFGGAGGSGGILEVTAGTELAFGAVADLTGGEGPAGSGDGGHVLFTAGTLDLNGTLEVGAGAGGFDGSVTFVGEIASFSINVGPAGAIVVFLP